MEKAGKAQDLKKAMGRFCQHLTKQGIFLPFRGLHHGPDTKGSTPPSGEGLPHLRPQSSRGAPLGADAHKRYEAAALDVDLLWHVVVMLSDQINNMPPSLRNGDLYAEINGTGAPQLPPLYGVADFKLGLSKLINGEAAHSLPPETMETFGPLLNLLVTHTEEDLAEEEKEGEDMAEVEEADDEEDDDDDATRCR